MQKRHTSPRPLRSALLVGAVSFLTAIGFAAVAPASAAVAIRPAASHVIPIPPAGWHPEHIARIWQDPRATTRIETLPPAACRALNHQHPGAARHCQVRDYNLEIRQPLPAGTRFATAHGAKASQAAVAASPPYYQYTIYRTQCSPVAGCASWATQLEAWGVYNGQYVYQWGVFCTARSDGPDNVCTWHGYFDNGGAYLSWCGCIGMQFGENSHATWSENGYNWNWEAGQRFWVDIFGTPFDYYSWY